jgi:hypothetical protein
VTYDSVGETYKFTISRTSPATLRLSQSVSSIWNTIGFLDTTDVTASSFTADAQRNHTEEYVTIDLGIRYPIRFIALLGPIDEVFQISKNATVRVMGSNLNTFTSPPYSQTITVTDKGALRFLDDTDDTSYRYWKISIIDNDNPIGPNMGITHLFIGDYETTLTYNLAKGFQFKNEDASKRSISESGVIYSDVKTKHTSFDSMNVQILDRTDRATLEKVFMKLGTTTPFFLSLDPTEVISDDISELTRLVVFEDNPSFQHVIRDLYSCSMAFREIV